MNPALSRGLRKFGRDILQVVAAGGATALVGVFTGHLNPEAAVMVAFGFKVFLVFAQNYLETAGKIPVVLPTPGLLTTEAGGAVGKAVGTVDTVADTSTSVVGEVLDVTGDVVGGVAGAVGSLKGV